MADPTEVELEHLRECAHAAIDRGEFQLRSCWNCNLAHDRLKRSDVPLCCFICGHWYFRGVDITEGETP